MRALLLALMLLTADAAFLAHAAAQEAARRHSGIFNGRRVAFTASVEPMDVPMEAGRAPVRVVSIAYLATGRLARPERPVMFLFNGGPGAASLWLHMGAFGPRRLILPEDLTAPFEGEPRVADNPHTVLDVADLVFIDPPGTGYSPPPADADRDYVFSARGDAAAAARFIAQWLADHDRRASPVFIFGESYGTIRSVLMLDAFSRLDPPVRPAGVFLLGQAANIVETVQRPANIVGHAANLPTLAAIAFRHGKARTNGLAFEAFLDEVRAFAMSDYLLALAREQELDSAARESLAERLSGYTGVRASYFLEHGLGISKIAFREELLRDQGLVLGYLDARYVGEEGDPARAFDGAFTDAVAAHLRERIGVDSGAAYKPMLTEPPPDWPYGGPSSPFNHYDFSRLLSEAMVRNPEMRLMIGSGYYDLTTTFGAAEYMLARTPFPRDRVELTYYHSGHMVYTDEASFRKLMEDTRRLIAGRLHSAGGSR